MEKNLYYIVQHEFVSCKQKGLIGGVKRKAGKFLLTANDVYDLAKERMFAKRGFELYKQIPVKDIDIMISTYGDIGNLLLALKCKKNRNQLKWIVDYRDPLRAKSGVKARYLRKVAAKVDKEADYITGVANTCIGSGKYMEKFREIPNGFDREDIKDFSAPEKNEKFRMVYTGTIYYGKSDLTLLFRIISELCKEEVLDKEKIEFVYAGKQFSTLADQAKEYGLYDILINKGMVTHKEALQLQYQADILCGVFWNDESSNNILIGKVLEYLMVERPILMIVSGKNKDAGAMEKRRQLMEEAELGCYLDVAGGRKNFEEAKQWFFEKYNEYIQNGNICNYSNRELLEKYSSAEMAGKFKRLIDACCNSKS